MTGGDSFQMGDVGAGAQVAQGKNIVQHHVAEGALPPALDEAFAAILHDLDRDSQLSDAQRREAKGAMTDLIDAAKVVVDEPSRFEAALRKVRATAGNAWRRVVEALTSDSGKELLGRIASSATKAAIETALRM